ncbi:hypothetical protein [Brazilian porcupinepox virus 1]|nr:hypothetical protein [Brazilian porcupinepox virus 1]
MGNKISNNKIKKYNYVYDDKNNKNILNDDIYINNITLDDNLDYISITNIKHESICNVISYSWERIILKKTPKFLIYNDLFVISESFLIKISHGDGFDNGTIRIGTYNGFIATICIKNDGISGIYIPNHIIKQNINVGDYIISRASNGIGFLPHICGDAIYILVSIVPSNKLINMGITIRGETKENERYKKNINLLVEKKKQLISIIDKIIPLRREIEINYLEIYKISEFIHMYNEYFKYNSYSLRNKDTSSSIDYQKLDILDILDIFKNKSVFERNNNVIKFSNNNDINKKYKLIKDLWSEIVELSSCIKNILNKDIEYYNIINKYIISNVNTHEILYYKTDIVNNLYALSNIGLL